MRNHLFLATPCYGGLVTQGYMQSVCALIAAAPEAKVDLTLALLGQDALITRCRNTLLSHFIANPTATHILFIDADISFEPEQVFKLVRAQKPVVAGMYPLKAYYWDNSYGVRVASGEPVESAGFHYVGAPKAFDKIVRDGDFATADFAGTGFMLITKETIEKMIKAYPETRYQKVDSYTTGHQEKSEAFALFDCIIDAETGVYLSEDFTFCRRWQRLGEEVWLDMYSSLTHTGSSDFKGAPNWRFGTSSTVSTAKHK